MLQVDMTLKLQVKIKRPEFTLEAINIMVMRQNYSKANSNVNNTVSEKVTIAY